MYLFFILKLPSIQRELGFNEEILRHPSISLYLYARFSVIVYSFKSFTIDMKNTRIQLKLDNTGIYTGFIGKSDI